MFVKLLKFARNCGINLSEFEFPKSKSIDIKIHLPKKFFEEVAMYYGHHLKAEVYIPDKIPTKGIG